MQLALREGRRGDILCFKGRGPVFGVLSFLLGMFDRVWRRREWKPWHMAFVHKRIAKGLLICEASGDGVVLRNLMFQDEEDVRLYRWFAKQPRRDKIDRFIDTHKGKAYDVAAYLWTALQYLILHWFNHPIPRLLDDRYTCWELVFEFCREMGKPIQSLSRYPMISTFLEEVEKASESA